LTEFPWRKAGGEITTGKAVESSPAPGLSFWQPQYYRNKEFPPVNLGWLDGLPRNCRPTDLDVILHNGNLDSFLVIELKVDGSKPDPGQARLLNALEHVPGFRVAIGYHDGNGELLRLVLRDGLGTTLNGRDEIKQYISDFLE
jgi:hypothetical protein